jgi:hypothetical protein
MTQPQSDLAKKLSIAIQALQTASIRNDGPGQHVAAEAINGALAEVDDLALGAQDVKCEDEGEMK